MKFKINKRDLSKHISIGQKAISSRSTLQILDGILLIAKDEKLIIRGTDLHLSIETSVGCNVMEEGSIVVNSRIFGDIVRKLPDSPITIEVENTNIKILCDNSVFNISGNQGSEYPELPIVVEKDSFLIPMDIFRNTIRQIVFATSQDESRPSLTGALLEIKDNTINFVALDGYRLAFKSFKTQSDIEEKMIIPAPTLVELSKIMEDSDDDVNITISKGYVIFRIDSTIIYSKLLEGQFFNYSDIIRNHHKTTVIVDKRELQNGLERASLLAKEDRANLVRLNIEDGKISISSNTEIGSAYEVVDSLQEGENIKIAFNSRYILEGIRVIDSDRIKLNFMGSINPCIIEPIDDNNYIYLVLPVRLAQEDS